MGLELHIQHANKAIHNAKAVKETSRKILGVKSNIQPDDIKDLSQIMQNVIDSTDKAIREVKLAGSRSKSRLITVKKAKKIIVDHTKNAKYAAIESRKTADAALETSKKMKNSEMQKKYQKTYDTQIAGSIHAAKVAEKETEKALRALKNTRNVARGALKEI